MVAKQELRHYIPLLVQHLSILSYFVALCPLHTILSHFIQLWFPPTLSNSVLFNTSTTYFFVLMLHLPLLDFLIFLPFFMLQTLFLSVSVFCTLPSNFISWQIAHLNIPLLHFFGLVFLSIPLGIKKCWPFIVLLFSTRGHSTFQIKTLAGKTFDNSTSGN